MINRTPDGWQLIEYHKFALGGVLFSRDMWAGDARSLDAIMGLPLATFEKALVKYGVGKTTTVADAILALIDAGGDTLSARGAALEFERRQQAYRKDCAAWKKSGANGPDQKWRRRYMTQGQRFLIAYICAIKRIAQPPNLDRGAAADWLEAHDAHPLFRDDQE